MTLIKWSMAAVLLLGTISTLLFTIQISQSTTAVQEQVETKLIDVTEVSMDTVVEKNNIKTQSTKSRDCPSKYLYFGNINGRHSNQIRSVIHALHFGLITNRTVVIPPFKQDRKLYPIEDLYDYSSLSKLFCIAKENEIFNSDTQLPAGCLERDGIPSKIVRQPRGGLKCSKKVKMGKSRSMENFAREASQLADVELLYMFETSYYKKLGGGCFWKNVGPSEAIAKEISSVIAHYSPAASIHLRGLEKSCVDRLKKVMKKSGLNSTDTTQCNPSLEYVKTALEESNIPSERYLYLADDLQRPALTQTLKSKLNAISYADYPNRLYKSGLYAMLIDFWMLVSTDIFLPNQASSLSTNAHFARIFRNYTKFTHGSYNWIPLVPDADPYSLEICGR